MLVFRSVEIHEKKVIDKIVALHIQSFEGFFLSSLHPGFLRQLYKSFVTHKKSDLIVAEEGEEAVGFIAYSSDTTDAYRHMLRRYFFPFVWYSFLSFLKKPSIFFKMLSALNMPYLHKRGEPYVKVFSIGVDPRYQKHGVGSQLIDEMKKHVDFSKVKYITLETDAVDNERANNFYTKTGFKLSSQIITFEGRKMNKYHYRVQDNNENNAS